MNRKLILIAATVLVTAAAPAAMAQPRQAGGPCAAASAGNAPGVGCSGPMGPMHRRHWGADNTSGWPMMTPEERRTHREQMSGFTAYADCKAYVDLHHQRMAERAKSRGLELPASPRRDGCAPLNSRAKP